MYNFIDVNSKHNDSYLPSEAMCFNGVYLEYEIPGYRTLSVSGRELMEADISDYKIGKLDGTKYQYRRYPPRTITVKYQLISKNNEEFRESFNKMNGFLSVEQAIVTFYDETDKYFIGTKKGNTEVEPGKNSIVGEFEIYCTDPRKFAITKKSFTAVPVNGILTATVYNGGTQPSVCDYDIQFDGESGFIGIVSSEGAMQFGDVSEPDEDYFTRDVTLVNGLTLFQNGTTGNKTATSDTCSGTISKDSEGLKLTSIGSNTGTWNGQTLTIDIPANAKDKHASEGSCNFRCILDTLFECEKASQTGKIRIDVLDSAGKVIAGTSIYNSSASSQYSTYALYGNDKLLKSISVVSNLTSKNPLSADKGKTEIKKVGATLTFIRDGATVSFNVSALKNVYAKKIRIGIFQYSKRDNASQLANMCIRDIKFIKLQTEMLEDICNHYSSGTVLKIIGEDAKVYVDGIYKPDEEVLGTEYFKLPPGISKVEFYTSDFVTKLPTCKVIIREAWL